jgi:hypothetical protein
MRCSNAYLPTAQKQLRGWLHAGRALPHQPKKYSLCREFVPERHLILDDHMYNGVDGLIRKPDSLPPVVSPDQLHALGFIEREPGI